MKNFKSFFQERGFSLRNGHQSLSYDFCATKKGRQILIISYTDFYFVKTIDGVLSLKQVKKTHDTSKKEANKQYRMPKALRLNVPNINSVFICNSSISQDVIDFVSTHKSNFIGGEQESIFVIDQSNKRLYCAGIEKTKITGEAQLIWGKSKEFKDFNGKNRAFTLINQLFPNFHIN